MSSPLSPRMCPSKGCPCRTAQARRASRRGSRAASLSAALPRMRLPSLSSRKTSPPSICRNTPYSSCMWPWLAYSSAILCACSSTSRATAQRVRSAKPCRPRCSQHCTTQGVPAMTRRPLAMISSMTEGMSDAVRRRNRRMFTGRMWAMVAAA